MPFIDANGARFNYRLDGPADASVVVFSNSLGTHLAMWDRQIPALSAKVSRPAIRYAWARTLNCHGGAVHHRRLGAGRGRFARRTEN